MVKLKFYDYSNGEQLTAKVKPAHFDKESVRLVDSPSQTRLDSPFFDESHIKIEAWELKESDVKKLTLVF